MTSSNNFCSGI